MPFDPNGRACVVGAYALSDLRYSPLLAKLLLPKDGPWFCFKLVYLLSGVNFFEYLIEWSSTFRWELSLEVRCCSRNVIPFNTFTAQSYSTRLTHEDSFFSCCNLNTAFWLRNVHLLLREVFYNEFQFSLQCVSFHRIWVMVIARCHRLSITRKRIRFCGNFFSIRFHSHNLEVIA